MTAESVNLVGGSHPVLRIEAAGAVPVFQQIVNQIRDAAVQGRLPSGSRLPAVRALAADLGVAVNTVAKAYRTLEAEGTVTTGGRNGTVIAALADASSTTLSEAARVLVAQAHEAGISREQAMGMIARLW